MRAFLLKTVVYVILVLGGFELLFRMGYLPVITDSSSFDRKMLWLQMHPLKKTELVAVGSSVPLSGLQSEGIVRGLPLSYFNFCTWNVKITETWIITRWIVREYRPGVVLLGTGLGDFSDKTDSTYFNYIDAAPFIKRQLPELFYFTHFTSVHQIVYRWSRRKKVHFDEWGGMPMAERVMDAQDEREMQLHPPVLSFDPQHLPLHYRALDSLSRWLRDQGVQLIFVQFPLPGKGLSDDVLRANVLRHIQTCRSIVESNRGKYLDYSRLFPGGDSLFADLVHLRPEGAQLLTAHLVGDLQKIIVQNR